jgi:hypothetical protein
MLASPQDTKPELCLDTAALRELHLAPFPRSGPEMLTFENQVFAASIRLGDSVTRAQIERAHLDPLFVAEAVVSARERSPVALRHKGTRVTSVLLLGGSRVLVSTPYLREDRSRRRGPKRRTRRESGSGCYPVLEALGIADRATPATRSEIALHVVQTASYREAAATLERRGLSCDLSTLVRVTTATAEASLRLRDAALSAALALPVAPDGPLAGKRVRVSLDGGRVRTRRPTPGRKTKKGRHGFTTHWREPRVLVIDLLDEEGSPDRLRLPLYEATIKEAHAVWALVIGYLRLLGAAHATQVEFIADGAPWIWDQVGKLISEAEIPEDRLVLVLDFYHAAEHLCASVEVIKQMPKRERVRLFDRLRHRLRHDSDGVERVIEALSAFAVTRRGKAMKKAVAYFETHREHCRYARLDELRLPVGSGQVESAIRRVVNLRFKAAGTFWIERRVDALLHLRAAFKSGRWDEIFGGVLAGEFLMPDFEPPHREAPDQSAEVIELPHREVAQTRRRKAS